MPDVRRPWPWVLLAVALVVAVGIATTSRPLVPSSATASGTAAPLKSLPPGMVASPIAPPAEASARPSSQPQAGTEEPLAALVGRLRVATEHRAGYERSLFVHWIDADGDGCNTRDEVLIAQAIVAPTIGADCRLGGGKWVSLYDGLVFTDASKLQIDHVVALAEAWDSGAYAWTAARREAFANDLGEPWELRAVSAASNEAKSDSDPADWLPPLTSAECPFLADYIATKARWALAVDDRERQALLREVGDCPGVERPYEPAP